MKYWKTTKRYLKLYIRYFKDIKSGHWFKFSKALHNENSNFDHFISINQEIKQNETFESKMFNFSLASKKINQHVIQPNQIFSFWNAIGNPNQQFKKGRTIQNGIITEDVGGGLCQVSGIIYYVSLLADLKVLERYNHSVDIYTEETRFCPLGTDATVAYGYKDLRILNTFSFPIKFELEIKNAQLFVKLLSKEKIDQYALEFKIERQQEFTVVETINTAKKTANTSKYKNL
jgi:vancomycin resistance protein VanW